MKNKKIIIILVLIFLSLINLTLSTYIEFQKNVNENDFFIAINKQLLKLEDPTKPMIVSISYNTDLMAMENLFPIISRWIEFAKSKDNLIIEIRTKSALFTSLKNICCKLLRGKNHFLQLIFFPAFMK